MRERKRGEKEEEREEKSGRERENVKKGRRGRGEMRRGMLLLVPLFTKEKFLIKVRIKGLNH